MATRSLFAAAAATARALRTQSLRAPVTARWMSVKVRAEGLCGTIVARVANNFQETVLR